MRLDELYEKRFIGRIRHLSLEERHEMLKFIHDWLTGYFMVGGSGERSHQEALQMWRKVAAIFPPKVPATKRLSRIVTVPLTWAGLDAATSKLVSQNKWGYDKRYKAVGAPIGAVAPLTPPAPGLLSSWTNTKLGLDSVVGVAQETNTASLDNTARVAISADLPGSIILATPSTIKQAFLALSHDYFERFPETMKRWKDEKTGKEFSRVIYPGYPGGETDSVRFSMADLGYIRSVIEEFRGGFMQQSEHVVITPETVQATLVKIYRLRGDEIDPGHDDPHNA